MGIGNILSAAALPARTLGICPTHAGATLTQPGLAGIGACREVLVVGWEVFLCCAGESRASYRDVQTRWM